jgi:hypothetical protein
MKLTEVLEYAGTLDDTERFQLWESCGDHDLSALPTTETGGGTPSRYCNNCWTAFSDGGSPINPPKFPSS